MKTRWNSSSLRLRITPTELKDLLNGSHAFEILQLPGGASWSVRLEAGSRTKLFSDGQSAVISLSPEDCRHLADPATEGVYLEAVEGIRYYVEKDFPCVHPRAAEVLEMPTETFAAPGDFDRRKQEAN